MFLAGICLESLNIGRIYYFSAKKNECREQNQKLPAENIPITVYSTSLGMFLELKIVAE